ncbi:hypothetical protein B296_00044150 [Ensete ventricosum]|uniref:Uncharacterized protein n=1 Tax=Ensete ventricosum TaxID=4639 RepID=A0A426ZBW7_ENSVE|nr:hypothetical protein B296_00044150 [Ensete ventricosum]
MWLLELHSEKPPKIKVIDFGSACFVSKTIYTYIQRGLKRPKIGKKYFRFVKLEDIVADKASRKNLPDEQLDKG